MEKSSLLSPLRTQAKGNLAPGMSLDNPPCGMIPFFSPVMIHHHLYTILASCTFQKFALKKHTKLRL